MDESSFLLPRWINIFQHRIETSWLRVDEITIGEGEGWTMLDRITGIAPGWRGGSSASGFDVVAGARVNPISRKRSDLVKKRGEKAFEYLVWEDNGWPMKRRREETKRWRVLPLFFFLSFLSLALSLVWTKRRSFDPNIVSGSSFEITTEFIFFDYHRVPLTPTSLFVFKKK